MRPGEIFRGSKQIKIPDIEWLFQRKASEKKPAETPNSQNPLNSQPIIPVRIYPRITTTWENAPAEIREKCVNFVEGTETRTKKQVHYPDMESKSKSGYGVWDHDYGPEIEEITDPYLTLGEDFRKEEEFLIEHGLLLHRYLRHLPKIPRKNAAELIPLIEKGLKGEETLITPAAWDKKHVYIAIERTKLESMTQEDAVRLNGILERAFKKEVKYITALKSDIEQIARIFLKTGVYDSQAAQAQMKVVTGQKTSDFVDNLIKLAVEMRASDIHVIGTDKGLIVNFGIDGKLRKVEFKLPENVNPRKIISRIKILSGLASHIHRNSQDGSFFKEYFGKNMNFRVTTHAVLDGEKATIRLLIEAGADRSAREEKSFTELGLGGKEISILKELAKLEQGFILFAGPTGSGKSTSLNAILSSSSINNGENNIVTIENPTEYPIPGATHIQVDEKSGNTFPVILKDTLRAAPDVILVGEIRDSETAKTAAQASLTGHLVFSTIHAESSSSVFKRLMSLKLNPELATSVTAVISQRLVPTICERCKRAYVPSDEELTALNLSREELVDGVLYKGCGCSECQKTGNTGRVGVFEIMQIGEELKKLIHSGQGMNSEMIEQAALAGGMLSLEADVKRKLLAGNISSEEALKILNSYRYKVTRKEKAFGNFSGNDKKGGK